MSVFKAIFRDFIDFFNLKTKRGAIHGVIALIIILIPVVYFVATKDDQVVEAETDTRATVFVGDVASLSSESNFTIIGTVSSQSQAKIQSEASGRVVTVPVSLGETVRAGAVIATLENASEYAALLQAEGAYEAAQAAASISDVGVRSAQNGVATAENSALSAYRNAYATIRTTFNADLDVIFADPERTYRTPGFRPKDFQQTEGRVDSLYASFERTLATRKDISTASTVKTDLPTAIADTDNLLTLVRLLSSLISDGDIDESHNVTETAYLSTLSNLESKLLATRSSLESAGSALTAAKETLAQAQIGGTDAKLSAANAQVKQSLGVLRAAQANYAKTIMRTPIAGTVNELSVEVGDFVGMQNRIALIANNNALQITAFVGENDRQRMSVGQTVLIEGRIEGVITEIAPAVDSDTKKFEIKIGTDDESLTNGDTVTVTIIDDTEVAEANAPLLVPITAIKFTLQDGVIFRVENEKLVSVPVKVGSIRGSFVEITEGIDRNAVIVVDARGLTEGQSVEAILVTN